MSSFFLHMYFVLCRRAMVFSRDDPKRREERLVFVWSNSQLPAATSGRSGERARVRAAKLAEFVSLLESTRKESAMHFLLPGATTCSSY